MPLTKSQIIDAIAHQDGLSRNKSTETVETVHGLIKSALVESGQDVLISGFHKFCGKDNREWKGRNPGTGEDMMLWGMFTFLKIL